MKQSRRLLSIFQVIFVRVCFHITLSFAFLFSFSVQILKSALVKILCTCLRVGTKSFCHMAGLARRAHRVREIIRWGERVKKWYKKEEWKMKWREIVKNGCAGKPHGSRRARKRRNFRLDIWWQPRVVGKKIVHHTFPLRCIQQPSNDKCTIAQRSLQEPPEGSMRSTTLLQPGLYKAPASLTLPLSLRHSNIVYYKSPAIPEIVDQSHPDLIQGGLRSWGITTACPQFYYLHNSALILFLPPLYVLLLWLNPPRAAPAVVVCFCVGSALLVCCSFNCLKFIPVCAGGHTGLTPAPQPLRTIQWTSNRS